MSKGFSERRRTGGDGQGRGRAAGLQANLRPEKRSFGPEGRRERRRKEQRAPAGAHLPTLIAGAPGHPQHPGGGGLMSARSP